MEVQQIILDLIEYWDFSPQDFRRLCEILEGRTVELIEGRQATKDEAERLFQLWANVDYSPAAGRTVQSGREWEDWNTPPSWDNIIRAYDLLSANSSNLYSLKSSQGGITS